MKLNIKLEGVTNGREKTFKIISKTTIDFKLLKKTNSLLNSLCQEIMIPLTFTSSLNRCWISLKQSLIQCKSLLSFSLWSRNSCRNSVVIPSIKKLKTSLWDLKPTDMFWKKLLKKLFLDFWMKPIPTSTSKKFSNSSLTEEDPDLLNIKSTSPTSKDNWPWSMLSNWRNSKRWKN